MLEIQLRNCFGQYVNLIKDIEDKQKVLDYFNSPNSWLSAVLDTFNKNPKYDELTKNVNKESVVLDLGGNVGLFSLYLKDKCKKIYSIEPTKSHFEILEIFSKNTNINPVNCAIAASTGQVELFKCINNTTSNGLSRHNSSYISTGLVDCYNFNDLLNYLNLDRVDFCKVDIETYELTLFESKGFRDCAHKIKEIFIECHGDLESVRNQIIYLLNKENFTCERIDNDAILAINKN